KRAYCLKTQPATGETYPKSDLFNKAHTDLTSAKSETADLILSAKDIAEHLSSHSAKVVGLSNLLDNNKIKEILAENI
ncbi:PTS sugar transporter subunit IIB, partial [Klebsiella pneumoniae subsp. pneumoniae]